MSRFASSFFGALALSAAVLGAQAANAGPAGGFVARNGYIVQPIAGSDAFTVLGKAGGAGPDYFCAAADYAYRRLGVSDVDRVVLINPVAPDPAFNGRRSGAFRAVSRDQVPPRTGLTVSMRQAGENLQIAHGRNLCDQRKIFLDD
ncbi:MAG: hypothetical protein ACK5IB_03640 [Qingshengfaniella sp.]